MDQNQYLSAICKRDPSNRRTRQSFLSCQSSVLYVDALLHERGCLSRKAREMPANAAKFPEESRSNFIYCAGRILTRRKSRLGFIKAEKQLENAHCGSQRNAPRLSIRVSRYAGSRLPRLSGEEVFNGTKSSWVVRSFLVQRS